ncbi:MAG: hypothetical protein ACOYT9_02645 [Patescibacteria group bacterium]
MIESAHPLQKRIPHQKEVEIEYRHFSVGAIPYRIIEGRVEVLVHHFVQTPPLQVVSAEPVVFQDVYKLMTETPEKGENPETTVARGLKEEFGAAGLCKNNWKIRTKTVYPWYSPQQKRGIMTEKTTDYFLVENVTFVGGRETNTLEGRSNLEWVEIGVLAEKMEGQLIRYPEIPDVDESAALYAAMNHLALSKEEEKIFANIASDITKRSSR